jgi:glycosyltransferase involved in cell wall biosynthesis
MSPQTSQNTTTAMPETIVSCRAAFIGSAGVPNRYGGFEAFLEFCGPAIARRVQQVLVTCDATLYPDREPEFLGMRRVFIPVRANGAMSVLHDLLAFLAVFRQATHIVVLGVSGAPWFPLFRMLCALSGKRLLVNVDGVEWRRAKFSSHRRRLLRAFDALAQTFAHRVIYDNAGLRTFLLRHVRQHAIELAYSGDHVRHLPGVLPVPSTALTVCRIEPENSVDLLIEGVLRSRIAQYTVVGNWNHSNWGRELRERFRHESRLSLLDPIYDADELARLRGSCGVYLHGHSVGGTNPSLVEMLFYECRLLCLDVPFHHHTAGDCAAYFHDADSLASALDNPPQVSGDRRARRQAFTAERIADGYVAAMLGA